MRSKGIRFLSTLALSASAFTLISCGGGDGDSARVEQTVDASKNGVPRLQLPAMRALSTSKVIINLM